MKKILYLPISLIMRFFGFRGYSAFLALNTLKKDILNRNIRWNEKLWAWKRGFTATRVHTYLIDESNYRNHIPDFDYYKLHPINSKYSNWIDDKLTMKYILAPFNEFLPKYYFQIENGEILKLMDCPNDINPDIDGIISLLKKDGNIALKLLAGSLGEGFYKLTYKDNTYYVNTLETNLDKLIQLIRSLKGYLVTEYIVAHDEIRKIYGGTPNTLRIQVTRDKNKVSKITGCFIRFGSDASGILESPTAGGIIARVGMTDGKISNANIIQDSKLKKVEVHPNTEADFNITIPHWNLINMKIQEISMYIPQLSYIGYDIIITDTGFKIIEINSLTSVTVLPFYYPILKDNYNKDFFTGKFEENPKKFKRILNVIKNETVSR